MSKRSKDDAVIDLCSDDEETAPSSSNNYRPTEWKRIKTESKSVNAKSDPQQSHDDDDGEFIDYSGEVEVVDPVAKKIVPARQRPFASSATDDDDVVLVGAANVQKLPHLRQHCPEYKFDDSKPKHGYYSVDVIISNEEHCEMCYCFACDCLVKDCKRWLHEISVDMNSNHCCAHDGFGGWTERRQTAIKIRQDQERIKTKSTGMAVPPPPAPALARAVDPRLASGKFHLREHCQTHKFMQGKITKGTLKFPVIAENLLLCGRCWCFCCDMPAADCKMWRKPGRYGLFNNHCCAFQADPLWIQERARVSPGKPLNLEVSNAVGDGPFAPDDQVARRDISLTKCRHCAWFSRLGDFMLRPRPTGCHDWCHKCGRIASVTDLGKANKGVRYAPNATDVALGEKVIPFRLRAHDPRKFDDYKQSWEDNNWSYSEADMEEELFLHRFGDRPTLNMILASLPILKDIPECGVVKPTDRTSNTASAVETEAMILDKHSHKALLDALDEFGTFNEGRRSDSPNAVWGDITAKFDKATRSGELTIRLFVSQFAFVGKGGRGSHVFCDLLGTWFDIYPFPLKELSGLIKARTGQERLALAVQQLPCPPFQLTAKKTGTKKIATSLKLAKEAIANQNKDTDATRGKLSFLASSGSKLAGGVATDDTSLKGCLQRYRSETLAEDLIGPISRLAAQKGFDMHNIGKTGDLSSLHKQVYSNSLWIELSMGVVSHHRRMNNSTSATGSSRAIGGDVRHVERYISHEDAVFAASNMQRDVLRLVDQTSSMKGMLEQLENLGHASVPFVEGLNIELLEFQKQGLAWALSREQCPGGIQAFWWPKVPLESKDDIYFNPILNRFRRGKPALIRGGFCASEMGLGKTILSLGLILCNPAPEVPVSGSHVSKLKNQSRAAFGSNSAATSNGWDEKLYKKKSKDCAKRGSIVSRGTLVVCPVSLVGQWIEEAKSKLKDPGLIYAYHGQSRRRDPMILARNAIVVTTYAVVSSDATYHAKKSSDAAYIAPLEQIRWWRIICDEGHSLRQGNTQRSAALLRLVSDHRWLVSGTPVNTSFNDLRNQLKFLGIENFGDMMDKFKETAFVHAGDPSVQRQDRLYPFGDLLFFLRSICLRHAQNQTYRFTKTTLMSLPPKTERVIEIDFHPQERQHYLSLENEAKSFYRRFKAEKQGSVSAHYLMLTQKLNQSRIASSGGHYPLEGEDDGKEDNHAAEEVELDLEPYGKTEMRKQKKAGPKYSEFAFQSKFDTLINELQAVKVEDPTSKSLVFSQYSSTLEWLQEELPKRGFQFRTLKGSMSMAARAKALHDFQADPPTTIFLLSMRAGNVGLNLTQANRVYLMEPCFNPALEQQAIGRVHRLGQKRPTLITRLVMKDSVETRIMKLREQKYSKGSSSAATDAVKDEKPHAPGVRVLIGNVQTDRAAIAGKEFDLLFGVVGCDATSTSSDGPEEVSSTAI